MHSYERGRTAGIRDIAGVNRSRALEKTIEEKREVRWVRLTSQGSAL